MKVLSANAATAFTTDPPFKEGGTEYVDYDPDNQDDGHGDGEPCDLEASCLGLFSVPAGVASHEEDQSPAHRLGGRECGDRGGKQGVVDERPCERGDPVAEEVAENVGDDDDDGGELHALSVPQAEDDREDDRERGQGQFVPEVQ